MKQRLFKITLSLISLILIVSMLSSCGLISIFIFNALDPDLNSSNGTNFDSIEYERPDFNAIHEAIDTFLSKIKGSSGIYSLITALSNVYEKINYAQTMYQIADIKYYSNVNDEDAKAESEYCAEEFAKLQVELNKIYMAILDAGKQNDLMPGWSDQEFELVRIEGNLYDDEYVDLQAKITKIENDYMQITDNVVIAHNGKDYTIDDFAYLYKNGIISDETYLMGLQDYYANLASQTSALYISLIKYNNRIAEKAGYDSYQEFAYKHIYSRDYTPETIQFVQAKVKDAVFKLYQDLDKTVDNDVLGSIYSVNKHTLKSYDLILETYFNSISPKMKEAYSFMKKNNLYLIDNKKGMQESAFTTYLPSYEMPFIFQYTYGNIDDISTFVHEFGHFYSYYFNNFESDGIIDVSEIQSQANELLFMDQYNLTDNQKMHYALNKVKEMFQTVIDGCLFDEFQQYVYENIDSMKTAEDISGAFRDIASTYSYSELYPISVDHLWAAIPHNFIAPFYYISYAMSALPALELYSLSLSDKSGAIHKYNNIIDETGYRSYSDVLSQNGLTSPFTEELYNNLKNIKPALQSKYSKNTQTTVFIPCDDKRYLAA